MVGKDGVTVWDSVDTSKVTPLVIHEVMKPVELGSPVDYIKSTGLLNAAARLRETLRARIDKRGDDALFVMRCLWALSTVSPGGDWIPTDEELDASIAAAQAQEVAAERMHADTKRFCEMEAA